MNPEAAARGISGHCPEASDLALFIDGRLEANARDRIWTHLQRCGGCTTALADAQRAAEVARGSRLDDIGLDDAQDREDLRRRVEAVVDSRLAAWSVGSSGSSRDSPHAADSRRDTGGASQPRPAPGPESRRTWWQTPWSIPVAAALVGVALWVGLRNRTSVEEPSSALRIAELLDGGAMPLPVGWSEHGWPATRGVRGPLSEEQTAFRLGVWLVDLHAAVAGGNEGAARQALASIDALLKTVEFAEPAVLYYQELERRIGGEKDTELLAFCQDAEAFLDSMNLLKPTQLALGKWTEAGRLAAAAGDNSYFERPGVSSFPSHLNASATSSGARHEIVALEARLGGVVNSSDLPILKQHLDRLAALGGR